jgi:hypothetical protein
MKTYIHPIYGRGELVSRAVHDQGETLEIIETYRFPDPPGMTGNRRKKDGPARSGGIIPTAQVIRTIPKKGR